EKFWSITGDAGANAQPSPDGKWIVFVSARDGWDHVYVMPADGAPGADGARSSDGARRLQPTEPIQVTKGKFEAWRPQWSPDGTRIAYDANSEGNYGNRQLYIATLDAGSGAPVPHLSVAAITSGRGTNIAPQWSPDGTRLLYQHTDPHNSADLWVADATPSASPARLTDSMPQSIDRSAFVEPEMVSYPGPDGKTVPEIGRAHV